MRAMLKRSPEWPAEDDLVGASLLAGVRAYLDSRGRRVPPPPQSAEAWRRFYSVCDGYIRRNAARGQQSADRDDCVQQIWADLLSSLPRLDYDRSRGRFRAWLATLIHSKSVDLIRQRGRHPLCSIFRRIRLRTHDLRDMPAEACQQAEQFRLVRVILLKLKRIMPGRSFRIFYRRCVLDQSTAEVAAKTGLSAEQVRFRLHRMRQKISGLIGRDAGTRSEESEISETCLDSWIFGIPRNRTTSCADFRRTMAAIGGVVGGHTKDLRRCLARDLWAGE